jgi:hypothetical protein
MSIVCCDNQSRTLCGQDVFEGVKCAEDCSLCSMLASMRPLPCPEGGHCDKVGSAEAETAKALADLRRPGLRGKIGEPEPAFKRKLSEMRNYKDWWTDPIEMEGPTIPPEMTDDDLADIIFERMEPFRAHVAGDHECPCWRCQLLRRAGYYPSRPFSLREQDYYIRRCRESS